MKVVISTTISRIEGYTVYDHIKGITWVNVDTLILHSCKEEQTDLLLALNNLPASVKTIVYINRVIDPLLYAYIQGRNGYIYDDESFITDRDSLDFLLSQLGGLGCEVVSASTELATLQEFAEKLQNDDPAEVYRLLNNKNYMSTVNGVLQSMSTSITLADNTGKQLSGFVAQISSRLSSVEAQQESVMGEIRTLRETVAKLDVKQVGEQSLKQKGSILSYGTNVVPTLIKRVLYIRCFGDIPYLATFLLTFQAWLGAAASKKGKNTPSKILIARPQLANYLSRYNKLQKLTPQSVDMLDMSRNNVFVTFEPNKKVMDAFFKDDRIPVYIVLDFMQGEMPLVSGHMVREFNAYSSPRIYNEAAQNNRRAPLSRSIFSIDGLEGSITIPWLDNYHMLNDVEKKAKYYQSCKGLYERLFDVAVGE